jgi:hypothetical protein
MLLCAFAGADGLVGLLGDGRVEQGVAEPIAFAWFALLLVGGTAAITGAFWHDLVDGALIMRSAMWPVGGGAAAYAVLLFDLGQVAAGGVTLAFGLLALFRARQLARHAVAAIASEAPAQGGTS